MSKIKRSQVATYVNVTPTTTPTYALLGVGVSTATPNMNPKTTEETYVHEDTASISVDSYAPTLPVEMTPYTDDDVFEYLDDIRINRKVLTDAETDIIEVRLYQTSSSGKYPATKQTVSVQVDNGIGGDGGSPAKVSFTFNYVGDPVQGSFNPTSKSFT